MTINEFRIGSYFYGHKMLGEKRYPTEGTMLRAISISCRNGYGLVSASTTADWTDSFDMTEVSPIPLTEELLLKFGYQKREGDVCHDWWYGENKVTYDWLICIKQSINRNVFFYQNSRHVINYVHQLQNLHFVLSGEELVLKEH